MKKAIGAAAAFFVLLACVTFAVYWCFTGGIPDAPQSVESELLPSPTDISPPREISPTDAPAPENPAELLNEAQLLVEKFACESCTAGELYDMSERLEASSAEELYGMKALFGELVRCAGGTPDRKALLAAAELCGMDEQTVLTAASCCWSAGTRSRSLALISFAGDCTLAATVNGERGKDSFGSVYAAQESFTYPFDRVRALFAGDDLTLVNFEGTLTDSAYHDEKAFYFRGEPEYAGMLPASGIDAVTVANNHSGDYLSDGYSDTVRYLNDAGVTVVDEDLWKEYSVTATDGSRVRIVIFAYDLIYRSRPKPDSESLEKIAEYKKDPDTLVIATAHWGQEYNTKVISDQRRFGRALIDAGADIVVGHHPHIVQGIECYKGKYIAYSVGNFCFGGNTAAARPSCFILQAAVRRADGAVTVDEIFITPCYTTSSGSTDNNYQPCIRFGSDGQDVIDLILKRSEWLEYGVSELNWSGI